MGARSSSRNVMLNEAAPLALFDASHGQPHWAQTGFASREMHANFAGVMELLCRQGCVCAPTGLKPLSSLLKRARLLIVPPPTGNYNPTKKCWLSDPETLFTAATVGEILSFVQDGGRLVVFAYRFGDSFTNSNLNTLVGPLGCLLNDDAVVDVQLLRNTHALDAYFDTPRSLLPLAWSHDKVTTVRWRTMATFTILPGANIKPLALSAGGSCISFNRSLRRISFASLPIAVAGQLGRGRFALFGVPHVFETGRFGLLRIQDNARFLLNVLNWLLAEGPLDLNVEPTAHHALGNFFFNNGLEVVRSDDGQTDQQTVAYVERVLRKTGLLKAINRPQWLP